MKFVDQVRGRLATPEYHHGWLLDDLAKARKYGYKDVVELLKAELLRRYRVSSDKRFKRKAALALAKETSAEHAATCSFQVSNMTEPCDCGAVNAALGVE